MHTIIAQLSNTNDMVLYNGSAWIYRNATSGSGNALAGTELIETQLLLIELQKGSDLGGLSLAVH